MSTVTVPQVNPNDEVTALSVNQGPNAIAAVLNGNVDDTNVSTLSGSKITSGTLPVAAFDASSNPETRESETQGDMVVYGLTWSATTGLGGAMTTGVAYINGKRLTPAAVGSNIFTASKDTYVYLDNTGTVQYNPQTNGAAEPSIPANYITLAKVVTGASTVSSVVDLRPTSKIMRIAKITATFNTTSNTPVQVPGLSATVYVPTNGRRLKMTFFCRDSFRTGGGLWDVILWDGAVGGTQLQAVEPNITGGATTALPLTIVYTSDVPFSAGSHTFNISLNSTTSANAQIDAGATYPATLTVEPA